MNAPLNQDVTIYNVMKARLIDEYGLDEDDTALLDTLDGMSDIKERLVWLAREARRTEAFSDSLKEIIKENRERKDRFDKRADKLRALIAWAMQETDIRKIEAAEMTLSMRMNAPSLVTTIEPENAPDWARKEKITYTFDRDAIKEHLEHEELEWAHMNNGAPSVTIRTK